MFRIYRESSEEDRRVAVRRRETESTSRYRRSEESTSVDRRLPEKYKPVERDIRFANAHISSVFWLFLVSKGSFSVYRKPEKKDSHHQHHYKKTSEIDEKYSKQEVTETLMPF